MKLLENLKWRYATKKFSAQKVPAAQISLLIEAVNLSASSTGLQPYRIFIIENPAMKAELGEGSFNTQIAESSHLMVFAAYQKVTLEHIEDYMRLISGQREIPLEALAEFKTALVGGLLERSDEENHAWAARQAYLALGTALIAAAELRIDSTPMEGFDSSKFDELLKLKEKGLKSVVTLALGYRDDKLDVFSNLKKVRVPDGEFATFVL
ncbi:nitroreductase family protein [Pedobacter mucosus]|uniref:nitroreductase family protein n=1 Tax=Pedobacter mucosus TaxID=2895286 RepID=UPI001EE4580E|nr:nitroreductase family protein [Pedobacter mucosus]UKT65013.1 nitroreductase family protein [Pedobacter mucosus]